MKYRKKPVVIEAFEFKYKRAMAAFGISNWELAGDVPAWFYAAMQEGKVDFCSGVDHAYVAIRTLEGDMVADAGDYIIQGVKGELYPCKPDIFAMTYEAAE